MEKKKLLKYLEAVIELEKSIIADQQIISNMQMRIGILAIPHSYSEPQKPEKPAHKALGPLRETHNTASSTKNALERCLYLIPAAAVLWVFVYRFIPGLSGLGFLAEVVFGFIGGIIFVGVIGTFGLFGISGLLKLLPAVISDIKHNDKNRKEVEKFNSEAIATNQKENDKADEEYRQKFAQYKEQYAVYANNVNQDAQRVKDEEQQIRALQWEKSLVEEAMKKTSDVLKQYYDLDILKPKYRNFPYAVQIYEYLFNGLCDNLEGTHNAYFILEEELRVQRIIGKMDIIISQLEKIKDNQVTLYQAMQSVRYSVNKVNDSVVRFADSYSRHTRVVWAQNDELRRTLRDNHQQLNAKLDEANRNFQLAMKKEHDQSPVGTYLSEQSARDLSYIANYVSYRDDRPGPSYLG